MTKPTDHMHQEARALLDRVMRIHASEEWEDGINPAQTAALLYLSRANRFSRSPSHVAEYLSSTRGTVSQTLKALMRKGLIAEQRSAKDKRSISYDVTPDGHALLQGRVVSRDALDGFSHDDVKQLISLLSALARNALKARGGKSFGMCRTCEHHRTRKSGAYCALLNEALAPAEADEICHEHAEAA